MGYSVDLFIKKNVNEEFICSICTDVFKDPVVLEKCEHIFCKECISEWLQNNRTCPVDRSKVSKVNIRSVYRPFLNLLNQLKAKCRFVGNGCNDIVALGNWEQHLGSCKFSPEYEAICVFGCGASLKTAEKFAHVCIDYLLELVKRKEEEIAGLKQELTEYRRMAPVSELVPTEGISWVAASEGSFPKGALVGGMDGRYNYYIARSKHNGALIPGKLFQFGSSALVAWGGEEHRKKSYEVLVARAHEVDWVASSGRLVPPNAIPGGHSEDGEIIYIGRAPHKGTTTVGKVHPSHGKLYISYDGAEFAYPNYEILVRLTAGPSGANRKRLMGLALLGY